MSEATAERTCPNCGAPLSGNFCASCGQKDIPLRQTVGTFIANSIQELFGVDGRLWRTIRILFLHPGRLTTEFMAGRRARYLGPHRVYLTASVLFFFILTILDPVGGIERAVTGGDPDSTTTVAERLAVISARIDRPEPQPDLLATMLDSTQALLEQQADSATVNSQKWIRITKENADKASRESQEASRRARALEIQRLSWQRSVLDTLDHDRRIRPKDYDDASALLFPDSSNAISVGDLGFEAGGSAARDLQTARTGTERRKALTTIARAAVSHLPLVMFLLLPVFALLMKLLYARTGWYYAEHLIFALHVHAFSYVALSGIAILDGYVTGIGWVEYVKLALLVVQPIYFVAAQLRVYERPLFRTLIKSAILGVVYPLVLTGGVVVSLLFAARFG